MSSLVSVLVITRDRRDMLGHLLQDLRQQDFQGKYEIVVVEETDEPQAPDGVTYVPHPMKNLGIAYARNLSVAHAKHDILVFIDDDCRIEKDWLALLVSPLQNEYILGVQGGVTVPEGTNAIGWAESLLGFPGGGVTRIVQAKGELQSTREISTLNACYRKADVLKSGGFSEHARFGGEDYLLAKQVVEHGELVFAPQAVVKHEARGSLVSIWPWFVRRGRAELDLWQSGLAPEGYGIWMLQSSQVLKLFPFVLLCYWSILPLLIVMGVMIIKSMWSFKWVLKQSHIPSLAWFWLPCVRLIMGLATDYGRIKALWVKS